ncbi:putative sugar ABC transporter, permease domain protein [Escherichia coli 99.1793]|nr:putative sugar ABC transporter, permease domain protein [Escherichia coli 99.1793]
MPFALLLLAPSLLLLGGLVAWPMVSNIEISFLRLPLNPNIESTFVGVSNYVRILSDPGFWHSLWMTVWYTAYSAAIFLIPICISFDTAEKRRYATYLILNRRFSFGF